MFLNKHIHALGKKNVTGQEDKYKLRDEMLPSFVSPSLAQRILLIGKSISFLRKCCQELDYAQSASQSVKNKIKNKKIFQLPLEVLPGIGVCAERVSIGTSPLHVLTCHDIMITNIK